MWQLLTQTHSSRHRYKQCLKCLYPLRVSTELSKVAKVKIDLDLVCMFLIHCENLAFIYLVSVYYPLKNEKSISKLTFNEFSFYFGRPSLCLYS